MPCPFLLLLLFRSCAGNHIVGTLWVRLPWPVKKIQSCSRHPAPLAPAILPAFSLLRESRPSRARMQIVLHWVSVCSTMEDHICLDSLSFKASFLLSHFTWSPQSFLLWEAFARPLRFPFRLQMEELLAVVIACKQDRDEGREGSGRGGQAAYLPGSLVSFFAQ